MLAACGQHNYRKVIVLAVDGMDPGFVESHRADLPNLQRLHYSHLATTDPPQSPVAWSTFITGLDPVEHGILDFVERDAKTGEAYLSTTRTIEPRLRLPLGPYELPLSQSEVVSMRKGRAFWEILADRGVPVTVIRLPANYPPSKAGREIAGMGVPDLRGTEGTFSYFAGQREFDLEGPPDTLRRDRAPARIHIVADADPQQPYARFTLPDEKVILKEGEWSDWLHADFPLVPHLISVRGMFRIFLKQVHPELEVYLSPVNVDPAKPALPIGSYATEVAGRIGPFSTLGIPEDTLALRQGVFDLPQFLAQSHFVLDEENRLLDDALTHFSGGLLLFYFSAVDQNSHVLWGRHDGELLSIYRNVDAAIGRTLDREPDAEIIVLSDHGFHSFDRAVHLNRWLALNGFAGKAFALGLNGLYVNDRSILASLRSRLLEFRDNGRPVITRVTETHSSPDLIVGYAPGYRASWQTAQGEAPPQLIEDNNDAWIADHCIDPAAVPAVLFATRPIRAGHPELKDLPVTLLETYGVPVPSTMKGHTVY
ncbi:MAG TPA: alkaline phosphatase family protein [Bryobacteraceae bacterium]|nr:alkaline phosphatase family protein [Bryobacteraceae bacterium]